MAKTLTVLRIFVASPNDVAEEGKILKEIVTELNTIWSRELGVSLEFTSWETHSYPGISVDTQTVINEEIADDYDIFVGIMWKRFGTPTSRAGSGTEEEFNRAYEKFIKTPNSIRVMFYFSNEPIAPNEIDVEQIKLVNDFKKRLNELGDYYWSYNSREAFASYIRMHLSRQVQNYGKKWGIEELLPHSSQIVGLHAPHENNEIIFSEEEDDGFLDLVERSQEEFEKLTGMAERMKTAIEALGQKINNRTTEIANANKSNNIKLIKRAANGAAEDLEDYAKIIDVEVPIFAKSYTEGIKSLSKAALIRTEFQGDHKEEIETLIKQVRDLKETLKTTRGSLVEFRDSIYTTPRMTTAYNHAKRHALSVMDSLISEMATAVNLSDEAESELKTIQKDVKE